MKKKQKTEFCALQTNIKYPESLEFQVFHVILPFSLRFAMKQISKIEFHAFCVKSLIFIVHCHVFQH